MSDVLKDELINDPLSRGYPGMSDADAAANLNTVYRTRLRAVSMTELREWAAVDARAFNIRTGIDNGVLTNQQRSLCIIADKLLGTDDGTLDPSNAQHATFINELVAADVLSADDKTALVAKATDNISRAVELGLGVVAPGHIENARY